ncbi:hypothetical protein RJ640_019009 [Escallonia rubra]|uniref:DUF7722 domain-containing protein n=1 Tax=Escallonia rubra TaxID=112253 RepID=A0AA88U179_9ASTE|nr:hypothetical protein RJ640_019009 [Escallonia rubra]
MNGAACTSSAYSSVMHGGGSRPNGHQAATAKGGGEKCCRSSFQMPLHYPRYKRSDYETMPEWRLECLLKEYGLPVTGDVEQKRSYAMGAFLWPDQNK